MPKAKAAKIADSANLIVGGYAMMKHELGFRIVNLNSGNALIVSKDYKMLETRFPAFRNTSSLII